MAIQLHFLGTGSGKPMPQRNVSCMALFRDGELFLFDCGEATQIQLTRSNLRPGAIEGIFLTHFHGDHVNGLPGLIGSLSLNQRTNPLALVGPKGLKKWLHCLRELHILWPNFPLKIEEITQPATVYEADSFSIETLPLKHRIPTWGYALIEKSRPGRFNLEKAKALNIPPGPLFGKLQRGETITLQDGTTIVPEQVLGESRPGLKIAYVTDTSPCDNARKLAENADVLIHEATYPAGDEQLAHSRGHSTAADAARCALESGAKQLILTHISQKYMRTTMFLDEARKIFPNTVIASDFYIHEIAHHDSSE